MCLHQDPDGKRSWHNILEAAGKTRPTLLETVYGLDVIIPGKPIICAAVGQSRHSPKDHSVGKHCLLAGSGCHMHTAVTVICCILLQYGHGP